MELNLSDVIVPVITKIGTLSLPPLPGKKTADCFPQPAFLHRDLQIDRVLPVAQPATDPCEVTVVRTLQRWIFAEAAALLVHNCATSGTRVLGEELIEHGHTVTLTQVEALIEIDASTRGITAPRKPSHWVGFCETGKRDVPVAVVFVNRLIEGIVVMLAAFDSRCPMRLGDHLLIRNADPTVF